MYYFYFNNLYTFCRSVIYFNLIKLLCQVKEEMNMNTDKIIAEKIASEYAPKKTSKVVALKKLDRKAKQTAEIFAYTFGIIGSLVMGPVRKAYYAENRRAKPQRSIAMYIGILQLKRRKGFNIYSTKE